MFTPPPAWRGIRVDYASTLYGSNLARDLDRSTLQSCVAIIGVEQDSVAWEKGLRPGMLISRVDGVAVGTPPEFARQVQGKDDAVTLTLAGESRPAEEISLPAP